MTLAASGQMSIGGSTSTRSINLELNRSATATSSLNETSLRSLAGVSSGAISISNFYGKSLATVNITNQSLSAQDIQLFGSYAFATSGYRLENDGDVFERDTPGGDSLIEGWISPSTSAGNDYEARATIVSSTSSMNGTFGTWLPLGTTREWSIQAEATSSGIDLTNTAQITIEIRNAITTSILDTATIDLSATVSTGF